MRRRRSLLRGGLSVGADSDDMDPMGFLINLFDVALVFALALMIALVSNLRIADMLTAKDFTVVKNPGQPNMEIITREGGKVSRYVADATKADATNPQQARQGQRVGTAYRLESGEIIYVPDDVAPGK
ncbi:DUF2149 domain-containing protein [Comamonas sp. NoAH]|uniref:DUF2149 domain-containing protein n=1 Tax=Comamonas halotolerans TaxID=3041496 RepID=UPI0024E0DAD0|nr:DUF2149 domain-containing protein [Comamonas sp. NoAH]